MPKTIKNILAVRNDRFGEFLLNIPAFRALKDTFRQAALTVVIDPYVRELAAHIPYIDDLIEWKNETHNLWQKIGLINLLRSRNFDLAIMLNPSKEFNLLTMLAGIPIRAGYNRKLGFLLTVRAQDRKIEGHKHEVEYNLDLAKLVGASTTDTRLGLDADKGFSPIRDIDNLVAIHPFTSDTMKQWPLANFRELTRRVMHELGMKVVLIGGRDEETQAFEFCSGLGGGLLNLVGKTDLMQLAALLKQCRLLISGDSGPVHMASAVSTPVIAIFRNDIPGKTAKRWGPWQDKGVVIEKGSLKEITIEDIFTKAKEMLE